MMITRIDGMLTEWGDIVRGGTYLGFPSRNMIHRVMREGAAATHGGIPVIPEFPERVQKVEDAILEMPKELRETVKCAYIVRGRREDQARVLSRRLGKRIRRNTFTEMIDRSHYWLDGRLSE